MTFIAEGLTFIIEIILGLYAYVLMLRIILPWIKADYYHPVSQAVVKLTEPILFPLKKVLPKVHVIDLGALILLLFISGIKVLLIFMLEFNTVPSVAGLLLLSVRDVLLKSIGFFTFMIIIVIIASWVAPQSYNPMLSMLHKITDPFLSFFRKKIPQFGGLDFSPVIALLVLQFTSIVMGSLLLDIAKPLI